MAKHNITHGHWIGNKPTPEYKTWESMKSRCLNPDNASYQNYGGRGISICEEWINCFESFLRDVGYKPDKKLSLDRINNDGNYEPGNVRWTDSKTQCSNKRFPRKRGIYFNCEFCGKSLYKRRSAPDKYCDRICYGKAYSLAAKNKREESDQCQAV